MTNNQNDNTSIKSKTRLAIYWDSISKFSNQGISFFFSIILARLLSPSDYGIIALPMVFLAVAQCFINSGFSAALIRKPVITDEDLDTAFIFNLIVGVLFYVLLFFASPLIADFYNIPILKELLRVSALSTIFTPLQSVQYVLLNRNLNYKTPAIIAIISNLTTGLVGIVLAYNGLGVWALVFQGVAGQCVSLLLIWWLISWKPSFHWSSSSFHYLFGFGSKIMASGLIDALYDNIYPVVIGKYYNTKDLGLYNRSLGYAKLPFNQINGMLDSISYPVLSKIQDDENKLTYSYLRFLRLNLFVLCPIMLGLSALAYPLVVIMITDKWVDCVPLLEIICFPIIFWPIQTLNFTILKVKGRSDVMLKLNLGIKLLGVLVLIFIIPHGLKAIGWGYVIHALLALSWTLYFTGKVTNISVFTQVKEMIPISLLGLGMYFVIRISMMFFSSLYLQLFVGSISGILFYILLAFIFRFPEVDDVKYLFHVKQNN